MVLPAHLQIWKGVPPLKPVDVLRSILDLGTSLQPWVIHMEASRHGSLGFAVPMVPAGSCSSITFGNGRIAAMHGDHMLVRTALLICLDLRGDACAGELVLDSVPCS